MQLTEVVRKLAEKQIGFTVYHPSKDSEHWSIQISDSLNNEQLKTAVELGGNLAPNGIVQMIGEGY
jgi:hypothetical protein